MMVDVAVAENFWRPVQEPQAGDGVTVYWLIGEPLPLGSVQMTVTVSLELPVADTEVGG